MLRSKQLAGKFLANMQDNKAQVRGFGVSPEGPFGPSYYGLPEEGPFGPRYYGLPAEGPFGLDDTRFLFVPPGSIIPSDGGTASVKQVAGGRVVINEIRFDYKGPSIEAAIGWALNLTHSSYFRSGDELVTPYFAFGFRVKLPEAKEWTSMGRELPAYETFGFDLPKPGTYKTWVGGVVTFGYGDLDAWAWLVNVSAIIADGQQVNWESMTDESYILAIASFPKSITLLEPFVLTAGAKNLRAHLVAI